MRSLLTLAVGLALTGCVVATPPSAVGDAEPLESGPWVELGGGREAFEVLAVGQDMEVERGPQGGQHIWVSMRTWGVDAGSDNDYDAMLNQDRPFVEFQIESDEGLLSFENRFPRPLQPTGELTHELLGRLVQFRHWVELPEDWASVDWGEREQELSQQEVLLRVVVEEADGDVLVDECPIRLAFPPRDDAPGLATERRP